MTLQASEKQ